MANLIKKAKVTCVIKQEIKFKDYKIANNQIDFKMK